MRGNDRPVRLAILVVYLFRPKTRGLFRLHLEKIRQNTKVPYRILGSVGHLSPQLAAEVAAEPDIEALNFPVGVLPGAREEHADLLERLFLEALKGDYTHFCAMHIDSFPVAPDWVSFVVEQLERGAEFATLAPHGYSACLFWPRSFYNKHRLGLLVPEAERSSESFQSFRAAHRGYDMIETGLGFIYGAWRQGLRWHEIRPTRSKQVYGDRIFHLVAGTRYTVSDYMPIGLGRLRKAVRPALAPLKPILPAGLWRTGRRLLVNEYQRGRDGTAAEKKRQLDLLLADPEAYLRQCGVADTATHTSA